MPINQLESLDKPDGYDSDKRLRRNYDLLNHLITELRDRELNQVAIEFINEEIRRVQNTSGSEKEKVKLYKRTFRIILKMLEKDHKIVPKYHYQNLWLAQGMAIFGIPIGVAIGLSQGNMAFIGVGLPLGIAIGAGIGVQMDKKARDEGRQLDISVD
jgi:hypothetical protein